MAPNLFYEQLKNVEFKSNEFFNASDVSTMETKLSDLQTILQYCVSTSIVIILSYHINNNQLDE